MVRKKSILSDMEIFHEDPQMAADELDAILFFIHKRYAEPSYSSEAPRICSMFACRLDVIFTNEVDHLVVEKRPDKDIIYILSPPVHPSEEEDQRIYLHNQYGAMLVRAQAEVLPLVRRMLMGILDAKGREVLFHEYNKHKDNQKNCGS